MKSLDPLTTVAPVVPLAGVDFHNVTLADAVGAVDRFVRSGESHVVVTANVDHLVLLRRDGEFREAYAGASLRVADGSPVVLLSRMVGTPLRERVTGADLLPAVCEMAARKGHRVFLFGGAPGVAERAAQALEARFPGLRICGTYAPPRGFENDPEEDTLALGRIREARPQILFACLGTPKQEKWIAGHIHEIGPLVALCVGAAIDFAAGTRKRAPCLFQRLGLEWLYRLLQEPGRLWSRYLVRDAAFIPIAVTEVARSLRRRFGQR